VDQVSGVAEEAVNRVEQIASNLHHPSTVRVDADASDVHGSRAKLHDEEDHVADGSKHTQRLDGEEIASVQRLPVAPEELLPSPLPVAFRCWFDASLGEDVGDRSPADLDLEPTQSVADLGVSPAGVLFGDTENKLPGFRSPSAACRVFGPGSHRTSGRPAAETTPGSCSAARSGSTPRVQRV
jgi:hypothetical protein